MGVAAMALSRGPSTRAEGAMSGERKGMVSVAGRLLYDMSTLPERCDDADQEGRGGEQAAEAAQDAPGVWRQLSMPARVRGATSVCARRCCNTLRRAWVCCARSPAPRSALR